MPLSTPTARKHTATRNITSQGFEREDGLCDIEAHLVDTRTQAYSTPWRGEIKPGTPAHDMWLRWTVGDDMVIRAIEVVTDAAPYPDHCPKAAVNYQRLVGLNVGKGFLKAVQARIGREEGCTHLYALLQAAANATMQTMAGLMWRRSGGARRSGASVFDQGGGSKPGLLGSCLSYAPGSPVTAEIWPEHYTGGPLPGRPIRLSD